MGKNGATGFSWYRRTMTNFYKLKQYLLLHIECIKTIRQEKEITTHKAYMEVSSFLTVLTPPPWELPMPEKLLQKHSAVVGHKALYRINTEIQIKNHKHVNSRDNHYNTILTKQS